MVLSHYGEGSEREEDRTSGDLYQVWQGRTFRDFHGSSAGEKITPCLSLVPWPVLKQQHQARTGRSAPDSSVQPTWPHCRPCRSSKFRETKAHQGSTPFVNTTM